jgi:hypothetical protein
MYMQEAIRAPDSMKFKEAIVTEVNEHIKRKHWEPDLPENTVILPAIWSMKRKIRMDNTEANKWKSRLNLGGHKMIKVLHYEGTYSTVVSWQNIRLFLILAAINGWHTTQIDFVMAYTHADIATTTYMELPLGVSLPNLSKDTSCLRIIKNIYGGKDSGITWFQHLRKHLIHKLHYIHSQYDECVFYHKSTIFIMYTDDVILIEPSRDIIKDRINDFNSNILH